MKDFPWTASLLSVVAGGLVGGELIPPILHSDGTEWEKTLMLYGVLNLCLLAGLVSYGAVQGVKTLIYIWREKN